MSSNVLCLDTVNTAPTPCQDMENFLETLYAQCQKGFLEIRQKPVQGKVTRKWISVLDPDIPTFPSDQDIFVGVATRKSEDGGGTKADIEEIPAVWVDIDFKDIERKEVEKRMQAFELEPSIVVESGHGLHLYWILKTPAQFEDIQKIEDVNQRIAFHFGGDQASSEAARILRVPGTYNQKDPVRLVTLESFNDKAYYIDDFNFLPQPEPPKPASSVKTQNWHTGFLEGVSEGGRHGTAISLAGRYKQLGLSEEETQCFLANWNDQNKPPLEDEELKETIKDIYERYGGGDAVAKQSLDFYAIIENSVMGFKDFMEKSFPDRPYIIEGLLRHGELCLISAGRGIGKTWLALSIAMAATRPYSIGKWKNGTPTACLYIDGEMAESDLQKRLRKLKTGMPSEVAPFCLLSSDNIRSCGNPAPKLTNPQWRNSIVDYLKRHEDIKLLILDNLACLTPGLDENIKRDWDGINEWLLSLRSNRVAVILIHHTGKDGGQRGTSAREDSIDVSIKLKRPTGYSPGDDIKFVVEFTKSRGLHGDAVESFNLSLNDVGGIWQWFEGAVRLKKDDEIIKMLQEGEKQNEIAKMLEVTPSYVSQINKKAKLEGILAGSKVLGEEENQLVQSAKDLEDQNEEYVDVPCTHEAGEIN